MILDYNPSNSAFIMRVPRAQSDEIFALKNEHGFDWSTTASTQAEAVLFTKDQYAAVSFAAVMTQTARQAAAPVINAIEASRAEACENYSFTSRSGKELAGFQRADLAYMLERSHSLDADQPGLGKTATAIRFRDEIEAQSTLIVCPANIRLQWAREIRDWSSGPPDTLIYPILSSKCGVHPSAPWTIISYDLLRNEKLLVALMGRSYDLLILDEAHYLKSSDAGRTHAVFGKRGVEGIAARSERIVALTGTPLPNRPRECYTMARNLAWEAIDWSSEDTFRERYNPSQVMETKDGGRYVKEKQGRLPELQNRLRANFMCRHLKKDVLKQLPEVRYEVSYVDKTAAVRKALEAERLLDIDPNRLEGMDAATFGHIMSIRNQMGIAKAPLVADYVDMLVDGGEDKLFLVAWHIGVLDILQERLGKHGLVRVDGGTSPTGRQRAVDNFRSKSDVKIFLGNIQAIGIGVDGLQSVASHAVFAENSWTPGENQQAVDRLHRIGQREGVLVEFLLAEGSIDERVITSWLKKLDSIDRALDRETY